LESFDIGGDVDRLDIGELVDAVLRQPGKERARSPVIGQAGVLVADRGGEEFEEPARRVIAGIGIAAGTASLLRNEGAGTGVETSTTAGTLRRSPLAPSPDM
jgi:hypothetical protein